MYFKSISEEETSFFAKQLLDYYNQSIDDRCKNIILSSEDIESLRNNTGWYNHKGDEHRIFMNIPNIMCAQYFVDRGEMDIDAFYAFLTLCTTHEYRHFLQGRCIYDGIDIDGYTQADVLNAELMLYVRYFFDAYYLINKGNVKYELDAEKFGVSKGVQYLKNHFPKMNAEKAMVDAVNFFAAIQSRSGESTLPLGCKTVDEIVNRISSKLDKNARVANLENTLFVYNPKFYVNHERFGLDEDNFLTEDLIKKYSMEKDGSKRDLMIVKRILESLEEPEASLEDFPHLTKKYKNKTL